MRYGVLFVGIATVLAWRAGLGGWRMLLGWPALSFALMGAAYLGAGPRVLGKRHDGDLGAVNALLLLPYLALVRVAWHLLRLVRRNRDFDELWPGVLVGRRLLSGERLAHVDSIIDLTSEFEEPRVIREGVRYLAVPTLDQTPPTREALLEAVDHVLGWSGTVYIHCAEGHGRAGTVAVCAAIARGEADDLDDAVAFVRRRRPGTRLTRRQRMRVREVMPDLLARRRPSGPDRSASADVRGA